MTLTPNEQQQVGAAVTNNCVCTEMDCVHSKSFRRGVDFALQHLFAGRMEAEALRSHELIEAYNDLCALMNDELNTMEKHAKGYNTSLETICKVIELQEKIKALNNYNKTDK